VTAIALWLRGLVLRRSGRLLGMASGIAVAVALVASIGAFLNSSQATMTARTAANVPVDWQVQAQAGTDPNAVLNAVRAHDGVSLALPVGFATTTGLSATTSGSAQTTGSGVVLGLPDGYAAAFPGEIRPLTGAGSGILLAQQTAANLHVRPGDSVMVGRTGLPPVAVVVDGVVDLPQANTLFQKVGAPAGSQPSAPPDNIMLIPARAWHDMFDQLAQSRMDLVSVQIHTRLARNLPPAPAAAFDQVAGSARNLETQLAGAGLVGDNLGAALDAARSDAAYATVMFLFLGLPGVALATLLVAVVATSGADRRRREQALLRARGATFTTLARLAAAEAVAAGLVGAVIGLGVALLIGALSFGSPGFGSDLAGSAAWASVAAVVGLGMALLVIAIPAWRDAARTTVAGARQTQHRAGLPSWVRSTVAVVLIGASIAIYVITTQQGYHLVLAPEGVASITVDYLAFLGPACLWLGIALLTWRVAELILHRGRRLLARVSRPLAGPLSSTVAASMSRQRGLIAPAVVLVGVTVAFAASTAVFNSTYQQQAEVDARLTNGADVTVTEPAGSAASPAIAAQLASVPGVRSVEPLTHRFAYVGADLQDIYGVRASTIASAVSLQDAYFQGATALELMHRLANQDNGILVSAETVKDFQLKPGDHLRLRLQDQRSHQLVPVTFQYVGIVKEFPTAPRDSFLVANASFISNMTHDPSPSTYLIDTGGASTPAVAAGVRQVVGVTPQVTDISSTRHLVGSSLTAVDLSGLTRVELGFAFAFMIGSTSLLLALGFVERRRTFALAAALGARPRQLAAFLWSEAGFILLCGVICGVAAGWALAAMLVAVLSGVFDPAPAALAVPWAYLLSTLGISIFAVAGVVITGARVLHSAPTTFIREL
jgi:putative ABC transport system permease protein